MSRRWRISGLFAFLAVAVAGMELWRQEPTVALVEFVVFGVLAVLMSPLLFPPPVPAAEAQRRSARDGRPVIYWRPGCPYCMRLRTALGPDAGSAHWVDIWADPSGAAAVRAITGGDETVPTMVVAGDGFVNPSPALVREKVRAAAGGAAR